MTRISNADQVLLLLRAHLERKSAAKRGRPSRSTSKANSEQTPMEALSAVAGAGELSEAELSRALIASMLSEEFGAKLTNDARFQQVISDVTAIIQRNEDASALLRQALTQLKHG